MVADGAFCQVVPPDVRESIRESVRRQSSRIYGATLRQVCSNGDRSHAPDLSAYDCRRNPGFFRTATSAKRLRQLAERTEETNPLGHDFAAVERYIQD